MVLIIRKCQLTLLFVLKILLVSNLKIRIPFNEKVADLIINTF